MCGEAEDAGGLPPAKDDNEAARHFIRQTLPILNCGDYNVSGEPVGCWQISLNGPRRKK